MSIADRIEQLNEVNPEATYAEIAAMVSVSTAYVRKVAQRRGLTFRKLKVKRKVHVRKTQTVHNGSWDDFLVERWADRPKAAVPQKPEGYQASGRQGSFTSFNYMRLV